MSEVKTGIIKLSNEKSLILEAFDGKILRVDTSSVAFLDIKKDKDGDHIKEISVEGKHFFRIGDEYPISLGNVISVYKIVYMIVSKKNTEILLFSSLPNKTTRFLLPLLGRTKRQLQFDSYFVNAFLDQEGKYLCIMYRFTGTDNYKRFEQVMMRDSLFVDHKDHDNYHVVYIFRIPKQYYPDIENFKEGKYSLLSTTLKKRIINFYGGEESTATVHVIERNKNLKENLEKYLGVSLKDDAELASKPNEEDEIYII